MEAVAGQPPPTPPKEGGTKAETPEIPATPEIPEALPEAMKAVIPREPAAIPVAAMTMGMITMAPSGTLSKARASMARLYSIDN